MFGKPDGYLAKESKEITNICGKKLTQWGYRFKWSFEEAIRDWFEDNDERWLK